MRALDIQERLPTDGIYILLDQAPEWPEGTTEVNVPAPVSGHAYPIDGGDFVPLAKKSVVGRGRTVRIGEHWNVWLRGKPYEVEITGFARLETDLEADEGDVNSSLRPSTSRARAAACPRPP